MYLEQIDKGELNDRELAAKSPFDIDSINKVLKINDEIKATQKDIEDMQNSISNE